MGTIKKAINKLELTQPTPDQITSCFKLISLLKTDEYTKGRDLATMLKIKPIQVRQLIQIIRKFMVSKFQNPTGKIFLIATEKGYRLTEDKQTQK
jgi:hypothetical protein